MTQTEQRIQAMMRVIQDDKVCTSGLCPVCRAKAVDLLAALDGSARAGIVRVTMFADGTIVTRRHHGPCCASCGRPAEDCATPG